jgi:hypothetical protein
MATTELDINQLLADVKKKQAATEASTAAAKKASQEAKVDRRKKEAANGFLQVAAKYAPEVQSLVEQIKNEVEMVGSGVRDETALKNLVSKYNGLIKEQQSYITRADEVSTGKITVDEKGNISGGKERLPKSVGSSTTAPAAAVTAPAAVATPSAAVAAPKVPTTASAAAKAKAVKEKGKVSKAPVKTSIEEILDQLGIVEAIANQDEEISDLVKQYADGKLTEKGFRQGLRTSRWRSTNSDTIRQRKTNLAVYNSLTPEERAQGSNSYALEVNAIIDNLQTNATSKGAVIPKDQLRTLAEKLYITGQEATDNVVLGSLKPFIKLSVNPVTGAPTVGGAAGDNYRKLVATANANGLTIKELPAVLGYGTIDEALQAIAGGESIATLQQNVRNFRMTGQPDFISAKLAQGIDYATIVSPYRTTAATVLELDPEKIKLDDPAIQLALQNNGMNLFDYKKALKKDSRWQYTENANEEISNKFLRIAQDFGLEA